MSETERVSRFSIEGGFCGRRASFGCQKPRRHEIGAKGCPLAGKCAKMVAVPQSEIAIDSACSLATPARLLTPGDEIPSAVRMACGIHAARGRLTGAWGTSVVWSGHHANTFGAPERDFQAQCRILRFPAFLRSTSLRSNLASPSLHSS
jgi:hypothetical protein